MKGGRIDWIDKGYEILYYDFCIVYDAFWK